MVAGTPAQPDQWSQSGSAGVPAGAEDTAAPTEHADAAAYEIDRGDGGDRGPTDPGRQAEGQPFRRSLSRLYLPLLLAALPVVLLTVLLVSRAEVANSPDTTVGEGPAESAAVTAAVEAAPAKEAVRVPPSAAANSGITDQPYLTDEIESDLIAANVAISSQPAPAGDEMPESAEDAPWFIALHTITAGESLLALALELGTTVRAIVAYNALPTADSIFVGQELAIPIGGALPDGAAVADILELSWDDVWVVFWTVRDGDSLLALESKFGATVDAIRAYNDLPLADSIYAGQRLAIPIPLDVPALP